MQNEILLTSFSKASGCSCKISPSQLAEIVGQSPNQGFANLLLDYSGNDDAALMLFNETEAIISTCDFFTPIVNDAFDFGAIAAANAISDVYAMGGTPSMAIAILGWPIGKIELQHATAVMNGAKMIAQQANIPIAGGHSIDSAEPFFGLAVTGRVSLANIKKNNTIKESDLLYLTKPIGIGIFTAAQRRNLLLEEHIGLAEKFMKQLNSFGAVAGTLPFVHAMTDVTGFGLAGHLIEMADNTAFAIQISYNSLPKLPHLDYYLNLNCLPDATFRNWNAISTKIKMEENVNKLEAFKLLPDPQTNGGLLIAIDKSKRSEFELLLKKYELGDYIEPIGQVVMQDESLIKLIIK
jgi:selenide,water dikinase